jgi:hypothetical protein
LSLLLPLPAACCPTACLLAITNPNIRLKIPPAIRTPLPQWLPPLGHCPLAAISLQTLSYFKNKGLRKRCALMEKLQGNLKTKKGAIPHHQSWLHYADHTRAPQHPLVT